MVRKLKKTNLILIALTAVVLTACGGVDNSRFIAQPHEPHGQVITSVDLPAQYLYAVKINKVDGQEIPARRSSVWLKPGRHEIGTVDASTLSRSFVPGLAGDRSFPPTEPLVLDVEAGKIYYVGLKADSGRREDWKLVVWKTEDQS